MIEESAYDEIDRYVNGQMRGEELNGFMKKLDSDETLRNETEWVKSTLLAMSLSGKSVMKQHIAASMSGTLEKYTPAKNAKSFWKKWWWAVSIVVVAAAIAVAVTKYWPQTEHEGDEHGKDEMPPGESQESFAPMSDSALKADSCAKLDSILLQMEIDSSVRDTVEIELGVGFGDGSKKETYYEVTELNKVVPVTVTGSYAAYNFLAGSYSGGGVAMPVTLNIRKSPPFTYELDSVLTLNSNYMCTKKMRFRGTGDTVIMTDSVNNTYILLRNKGKMPFIKQPRTGKG